MSFRLSGPLLVFVLVGACGPFGQQSSPAPSCVSLDHALAPGFDPNALHVINLSWADRDHEVIVHAATGPFADGNLGGSTFFRVSYPQLELEPWFSVAAYGSDATPDGTVYWLDDAGIWARGSDSAEGDLLIPIPDARQHTLSWRATFERVLLLRDDTGGMIEAYRHDGVATTSPIPADPVATAIWASADGQMIVVTRLGEGGSPVFAIHQAGEIRLVEPDFGPAAFEWLAESGQSAIFLDQNRGLVSIPIDMPTRAEAIGGNLPSDYNALTVPTSAGLIAFSDRAAPANEVCFGLVPAGAVP